MPQKLTEDEIREAIEARGFELRGEYVNSKTKMNIWCPTCQTIFKTIWNNFRKGHGCNTCAINHRANLKRTSISVVKGSFEEKGWTLLSPSKFKSAGCKLDVKCPNGHTTTKRYDDFLAGKGCWECKSVNLSKLHRLPVKKARNIAKKARLKLIGTDYKNMKDNTMFECLECEFQFETCLDSIKSKGTGCPKCKCSEGERQLLNYIETLDIPFDREYKFAGCRDKRDLPFDVVLHIDEVTTLAIEIDGIQHFESVSIFGGENALQRQRRIDVKKSLYCYNNMISLLRISYMDIDKIQCYVDDVLKRLNYEVDGLYYSDRELYSSLISAINEKSQKI